jgi:putative ABC transport system substrate-binding protein
LQVTIQRRTGLIAIASAILPASVVARDASRPVVARIGILCSLADDDLPYFLKAMRNAGYEKGRNVEYIVKESNSLEELKLFARELVAARVDLIIAESYEETTAVRSATTSIPIVMLYGVAPVEMGFVQSLSKPGGNITGTAAVPIELPSKCVDVFYSAVPSLKRTVVMVGEDPWSRIVERETQRAAQSLGIATKVFKVRSKDELDSAFSQIAVEGPDGISVGLGVWPYFQEIADFAASHRLPAMYPVAPAVISYGGLISYSPNFPIVMERTAAIVDRILRGARPQDVPIEQPTRFVLCVNMTAAKRIGMTFPQPVLLRADIVID